MKIKYFFICLISILIILSISQIFSIPPYAGDAFPVYKSGYFRELDREFGIIGDSFINIKMMSKPAYAWIFLKDMEKKHGLIIRVYNNNGMEVPAPGMAGGKSDSNVVKILNSMDPENYSIVKQNKYFSITPVFLENRCRFCHKGEYKKDITGLISFERKYDAVVYYTSERVIIFTVTTLVLLLLLYYIIRWEPGRHVKELFDK